MSKIYIVWNNKITEGFVTKDYQLAYEVRKGSEGNCHNEDGSRNELGLRFIELYSCEEDCTLEEINI